MSIFIFEVGCLKRLLFTFLKYIDYGMFVEIQENTHTTNEYQKLS